MTIISELLPEDWQSAFAIETQCHSHPWSAATFQANQGERFLNLRADDEGELAGFAICQVVLDEASLFNIAVSPTFQRRGIARQLITALSEQLLERGVMMLWLEVRASNLAAIALYESLDFNEVSRRPNYYPSATGREDALIMALTL
ncbi:ribosomal protein S18-alanine N-acetyltransferase [Rosenbergiella epipactidis]|uniref:ribosomal protein S18-alanine N-acetyltransferase n=1 Tax=Rosenbergiella TaxID=1356488 RepID=UPI0006645850|nr:MULTISPECIES: ribosomal protein S18-alanine N-acetyltransferase [Rosenbergiella]KMV74046.1 ribosomal-protein-alanine acetyltransferase [bacteria symbiont BFo2 of Frankliniella occidentalis]KYP96483.1 ribosomal-protein-alanine acetyltransferase [bacteria symbiont BFo2 of Frankliniella occidentalis]MBT0717407.1 ribosomal protein S18-alanine N-acetyltransferase [Rosenbergiella epipactidis]MCL9668436.1 ribosomal protein S18-alanine N-acetyltransferase [Rosenbergiella epipactidis]